MDITEDLLSYLEKLSRLNLTKEEKKSVRKDLGAFLSYINMLNEVNTGDTEPISHTISMENVFREDLVTGIDQRDRLLAGAPAQKDGAFQVPRTVE